MCEKEHFFAFFAHWYTWSSTNYIKKITLIKNSKLNNLRFSTTKCTHLKKKTSFVDRKVFKLQRDSSVTLHVSHKIPILEGTLKMTYTKIQISPQKIFLSDLDIKLEGVGPVDDRPSTNKLRHFVQKKIKK